MSDFRHIVMALHSDDGVIRNNHMDYRNAKMMQNTRLSVENREQRGCDTVSAVRHIDMGFHSTKSASRNKNMGYRSDDGVIGQKRMGYRSVMS